MFIKKIIKYMSVFIVMLIIQNSTFASDKDILLDGMFKKTGHKTSVYIKDTMSKNNIIGLSIALVYDGKIVWADGFGWADKEKKIPSEVDTIFMLGSGSKTITTAALLQYMDKGKIKLDDPVRKYIPEFNMLPRFNNQNEEITIRRLLNHHSGIPGDLYNNMGVENSWEKYGNDLYIDWLINYLNKDYLSYKPGEIAIYCNTGFMLAGEIIKRLSGDKKASFNQIIEENLLVPLNMKNSSFNQISNNLATGYIQGNIVPSIQFNGIAGATGGLFTNVIDMSKFISMLLNEGTLPAGKRILNSTSVAEMGVAEISVLDVNSYFIPGLGLDCVHDASLEYAGRTWIKDGSTGNYNSIMGLLPDKKLGVIILTNCDTSHLVKYSIMRECLKNALNEKFGLNPVMPELPDMESLSDIEKLTGKYVTISGFDRIVSSGNNNNLIWEKNAFDDKNKECKTIIFNGKRFTVEGSSEELVFKELDDQLVMIQYGSNGSDTDRYEFNNYVTRIIASKYHEETDAINNAHWKKRLNEKYVINNIGWNSLAWDDDLIISFIKNGNNMFINSDSSKILIKPKNNNTAFVPGLSNRHDSSVRFIKNSNAETINFGGYSGVSIAKVMDITNKTILKNQKIVFPQTVWYKLDAVDNAYKFKIDNSGKYKIRLFNKTLSIISEGTNELTHLLSREKYYLAVTSMPDSPEIFDLNINSNFSD